MAVFRHPTWERFKAEHPPGSEIIGKAMPVVAYRPTGRGMVPYGVYVDLGSGMLWRAFLPVEQMAPLGQTKAFPKDFPREGDRVAAFVRTYVDEERIIELTQVPEDHVAACAR
jgi:hypothetical protein